MVACLVATDYNLSSRPHFVLKPAPVVRLFSIVAALVALLAYLNYALIPVATSTEEIRRANQAIAEGRFEYAHELLDTAAEDDHLSPAALSLNGRLYLRHFELTDRENPDLLLKAEQSLLEHHLRAVVRIKGNPMEFNREPGAYWRKIADLLALD